MKLLLNTLEVFKLLREKGVRANTSKAITKMMTVTIQTATSNLVSKQDLMAFQANHIQQVAKLRVDILKYVVNSNLSLYFNFEFGLS